MDATLPFLLRGRFEVLRRDRTVAVVRSDFVARFEELGLAGCAAAGLADAAGVPKEGTPAARPPGRLAGGRGATGVVSAGALGEAVVRTFRRGGLARHVSRQRYLLGDRAFDELLLLERLRRVGAPVPEPLAAVQTRLRPGYAACLVTRRLRGVEPAAQRLRKARSAEVEAILESAGRAVRRLHDAGGRHADLNAWNVLVPVAGPPRPAWVVDLDRGRFDPEGVPRRHRRRNLARLRRSLRKLGLADALAAWPAFERGYASPPEPVPAA